MNPRTSSLALFLLATVLAVSPNGHAGTSNKNGNPFSQNGTYFPNNGTFTAIMRGQNLMGVTQFSIFADGAYPSTGWNMLNGQSANTISGSVGLNVGGANSTTNTFGTPGFVSVYYNGTVFNGPAFSVLNMAANQVASVFYTYDAGGQLWSPGAASNSNASGPNTNTFKTNIVTNTVLVTTTNISYYTTTNKVITNVVSTTVSYTNATNPSLATTNFTTNTITNITTNTVPYATNIATQTNVTITTNVTSTSNSLATALAITTNSGGSYNYYDGNWSATFQNQYPNQTFNGSGVMSLGQPNNPTSPSPINQPNGRPGVVQISFTVTGTRVSTATSQIY